VKSFTRACHQVVAAIALAAACAAFAADDPDLNWVGATRGSIPKGSLAVGRDAGGQALYACRARLANGADVPGRIREPLVGCNVVFGGLEWTIGAYQVLRDDGPKTIHWAQATDVPQRAYKVGREANGTALYLCRAKHSDGSLQIGRVSPGACLFGVSGKEEKAAEFEVLVKP
jgi:DM9 repeat